MVLCSIIDVFKKIADKCVQPIVGYVTTEVGYLSNYKANIENLRPEVENLNDATKSLKDRIEDARNRSGATQVDAVAQRWLERMTDLNEEASRIIRDEERETERCLMGLRPNPWACYLASKSARKVMGDAEELKKDGAKIDTVAHIDYSQCLGVTTNPDFAELESRKEASDQIVKHLKDPAVKIVGMHGMGGAGKTTLAEKIGVQLYEDGTFKYVVIAVVSNQQKQDPVHHQKQMDGLVYAIQKRIADLLKIELKEKDGVEARAKQLREQLVLKDKLLIILDDIWHRLELRDVGIPLDSRSTQELKVLITSRDLNVMNEMNSKHNVLLDILTPADAWKLFDRMADGVAQEDSVLHSTAKDVVKQCGGIPVLLVTIARALRNKGLETWKEALLQLEKFDGDKFVEDGYKRLEVSYNFLPHDEIKSLFLLCAQLVHHSIPIQDLLRYTMGLGLFKGREKLKDVSGRLHMHLEALKDYCLLQDGKMKGTVRMHDVVYKFAVFVASRDHHMFIVSNESKEWPLKGQLEQLTAISLPYCHLPLLDDDQIPAVLFDTPNLESFLMYPQLELRIPDNIFIGMTGLKLLDLRKMSLSPVLPTSLSILVKLQTLCLDYCELDDIAMIGELRMLQILSLKGSNVAHLPTEIENLIRLKVLDLSECNRLKVIAPGVLSKLTLLEDLRIESGFNHLWEQEGCSRNGTETASLEELRKLQNLSNLQITIDDGKMYPKDLIFVNLETFRIGIECPVPYNFSSSKSLGLDLDNARVDQLDQGIKALMERAENLSLENIEGFTSLCELINLEYFPHLKLKHLKVAGIAEIPYIAQQSYERTTPAFLLTKKIVFPRLEELELTRMRVGKIWEGQLAVESFQSLTSLKVSSCHELIYLFSSLMVENLGQLKVLIVQECNSVEEIVVVGGGEMTEEKLLLFPKLEMLSLVKLKKLKFFCHANLLKCPSLKSLVVHDCKELLTFITNNANNTGDLETINSSILFDEKVVFPNLEDLTLIETDQLKMIWGNELHPDSLSKLKSLTIRRCASLESVFPAYLSMALQQFEKLILGSCERMWRIVSWKEAEAIDCSPGFVFSKLKFLALEDLPRIEFFYLGPCLKRFTMWNCHKTDMFEDGTFAKIIPILDYYNSDGGLLYIHYPELFGGDSQVFPVALLQGFQHLKKLVVERSNLKQLLFRSDLQLINPAGEDEDTVPKILARIQSLELTGLPKMTYIWSEHSSLDQILHNLESLYVKECDSLISLAPSTALLQNLRHLNLYRCQKLKQLLTSSTARSLINLIEMTVGECESLTEIVGDIIDEDEDAIEDNDIVFGNLKELKLVALTSLTSFCSAHNCSFKFPSLNSVTVQQCPNMVFFSPGILTAPKLMRVMEEEELWRWEGDLNSTIRQWHSEQMTNQNTKKLHSINMEENSQGTYSTLRSDSAPLGYYALQRESVFPERPGQPDCLYYLRTGHCNFGAVCRFHHPRNRLIPKGLPLRPTNQDTKELHNTNMEEDSQVTYSTLRSGSAPLGYYALQRESVFPERRGQPDCVYYLETGHCKFGAVCPFHHPRNILIPEGLPLRPGEPLCIFYSRCGFCKFGARCKFDHPRVLTYNLSTSASADTPVRHLLGYHQDLLP